MEVSWLSPAVASAPGHSCPPWQLSDTAFFGAVCTTRSRQREAFLAWCLVSKASLCHLLHFYGTKELGSVRVWGEVPAAGEHMGYRQHTCPCHGVLLACLCHVQRVLSPCIWGQVCLVPHCWAGLLITQSQGLASACSCDNAHLLQSVLYHRAWGHQKQSTIQHTPGWFPSTPCSRLLRAFKAQKPSKPLLLTEKTSGRHPNFICMPNYPAHQLSCLLVHPHRRDVYTSQCSSSAHRHRAVSVSVMGELHLSRREEQALEAQVHDGPRQVTSQLFSLPKARSILPRFSGTVVVFLHKSIQR